MGTISSLPLGKDGYLRDRRGRYLRHQEVGPLPVRLTPNEARACRRYLEAVAVKLLSLEHNIGYAAAYKQAVRIIRQMKPD